MKSVLVKSVLLACLSGAAFANSDPAIRNAFAERDYARVVVLANEYLKERPNSAINWYRMAIAYSRLGDGKSARFSLDQALRLDPSKSFASSEERVTTLEEQIRQQLAGKTGMVTDVDPAAFEMKALLQKNAEAMQTLENKIEQLTTQVSTQASTDRAETRKAIEMAGDTRVHRKDATLILGLGALGALLLGFIVPFVFHWLRDMVLDRRRERLGQLSADELLVRVRDDMTRLKDRLIQDRAGKTPLCQIVDKVLPLIEREAGRSRIVVQNPQIQLASPVVKPSPELRSPSPSVAAVDAPPSGGAVASSKDSLVIGQSSSAKINSAAIAHAIGARKAA